MDTQLILLEGLAGSGKSTLGQVLTGMIGRAGHTVQFLHEFDRRNPTQAEAGLEFDRWREQVRDRWRQLIDDITANPSAVTLIDGALLQCPVAEALEQGRQPKEIRDFVDELAAPLASLRPVLIYLHQEDVEQAVRQTYAERESSWQKKVESYLADTPFGKQHDRGGFDLYVELNRQLRTACDDLMGRLGIHTVSIDTSDPDWPAIHRQVTEQMEIPYSWPEVGSEPAGTYDAGEGRHCLEILPAGVALLLVGMYEQPRALIPGLPDQYFVNGKPSEVYLLRDDGGVISRARFVDRTGGDFGCVGIKQ